MLFLQFGGLAAADDFAPISVGWRHTATAAIPNVSKIVVFEESICSAQVIGDHVQFEGLARGSTPVFFWQGEKLNTVLIHVVEVEEAHTRPSLENPNDGKLGGTFSSNIQSSRQTDRVSQLIISNHLDVDEQVDGNRLRIQVEGESGPTLQSSGDAYNVRTASVQYTTAHGTFSVLDFSVDVSGGAGTPMTPYLSSSNLLLRGFSFQTKIFGGELTAFAGATLPSRFLYFGGTRDVTGASWHRQLSKQVRFSATAAATNVPVRAADGSFTRSFSAYALASLRVRLFDSLNLEEVSGVSNHGGMLQGALSYSKPSLTLFGTGSYSALSFPLNQLRLLPSGHATASAGANVIFTPRLTGTLLMQHTSTKDGVLLDAQGTSEQINPSLSFLLTHNNRLTVNYVFDRTSASLQSTHRSHGSRVDIEWSSQLSKSLTHTLRVSDGALSDPFAAGSSQNFGVRESVNWRAGKAKSFSFLASYDRANPSLAAALTQNLTLLSPALQELYYVDPAGFLQQQNLPPVLLNVLENLRPSSLSAELDGWFQIGDRLNFSPSVSYIRTIQGPQSHAFLPTFGFSLNYRLSAGTTLRAGLTNSFILGNSVGTLRQVSVFSFGLNQSLRGLPRLMNSISGTHGTILGRVFRDTGENGIFHAGKTGFPGLRVELSNGAETYTDTQGRYRFDKLPLAEYTVRLPLLQFSKPIRVTTPSDRKSDLRLVRTAQVDFGIIDFSRVRGAVYNDYMMAGVRAADAPVLSDVRIVLTSGDKKWDQVSDETGEFEFINIPPGKYQLLIDAATVPENFHQGQIVSDIVVQSAQTVTADLPMVALRSIRGVILQSGKPGDQPKPLPGVQVSVGEKYAITSASGAFMIRDLPAGDLRLVLVPALPLPPGKAAPSGLIYLSRDPMEGNGVRIVISDNELLRYLVKQAPVAQKPLAK